VDAPLPAAIRTRLEQDLIANQCRVAVLKEEFGSLLHAFTEAGVDFVVLKGFALVPEFCPDAALRSQYDYDFLVHPESTSAARRALEAHGYSLKVKNPDFRKEDESLFTTQALAVPPSDQNFYTVKIPRAVELHLRLWEPNREMFEVETPIDVLNRKRMSNWEGLSFPTLAEDDALIFQALHAFQHIIAFWCRPSCFLEIAYFIERHQYGTPFWERFRLRVNSHRNLLHIVGLVFSMADLLFEAPLAPEVARWATLTLPPVLASWVQRRGQGWALARFPGSKLSLFVHQAFIDDPSVWKEVERSRLFPYHRPATVVESADQRLASQWQTSWDQANYVFSRLKFHLGGLLSYAWELPSWRKTCSALNEVHGSEFRNAPNPK
jgi:hypothetical protein